MRLVLLVGQSCVSGSGFAARDGEFALIPAAADVPIPAWLSVDSATPSHARNPYDEAIARARNARKDGEIVAILWHQCETGTSCVDPGHEQLLRQIIANFRHDLDLAETVPFIMGTPSSSRACSGHEVTDGACGIAAAMERVVASTPYAGLVNASVLANPDGGPDFAAEQDAIGDRYLRMWKSMTSVSPEKLSAQAEKYGDAPRFRTGILLDPGKFLVTSTFGQRVHPVTGEAGTFHAGIDGALWNGRMLLETGICAWRDGVVAEAADTDSPAGTYVAIGHGEGLVSRYFHLERGSLRVATGDHIREGEFLGWMGKTGRATGEHLHFQLERDGTPIDPLPHLSSLDRQTVKRSNGLTDKRSNGLTDERSNGGALP